MKTPVPVTLDDLQATARDDKARYCVYRDVTVFWNPIDNCFSYMVDHWRATEQMVIEKLGSY